jgi:hypothetical protein
MAGRIHIFNTFFYSRLSKRLKPGPKACSDVPNSQLRLSKEDEAYAQCMREKYHAKVSKWTKTVDIFSKDFLFIPICRQNHWILAVICYPGRQPTFDPDSPNEPCLQGDGHPCIIMFDSLNFVTTRSNLTYALRYFLEREWQLQKKSDRSFAKSLLPEYFPRSPKQPNDYDCALFVMEYVKRLCTEREQVFTSDQVQTDLRNWFDRDRINDKRAEIIELILKLSPSMQQADLDRLRQMKMDARAERLARRREMNALNLKRKGKRNKKSGKRIKKVMNKSKDKSIEIDSDATIVTTIEVLNSGDDQRNGLDAQSCSIEIVSDHQSPLLIHISPS